MERLFSPCTRLHDILESQGGLAVLRRRHPELLQELNLDVSTRELLSAERAFTYADLYAMLGNQSTIAWLTSQASIARFDGSAVTAWGQMHRSYRFCFNADGQHIDAFAFSIGDLWYIVDVILRLLAVSAVHRLDLYNWSLFDYISINAPTLAYLMEHCQSLKVLTLKDLEIDEDHIRVLGTYSRPDLEIVLTRCAITSVGTSALVEVLGRNQGPTKLDCCRIDNLVLANGLRENSRLKSLIGRNFNSDDGEQELVAIASAVKENKGLVDLELLYDFGMSDETWGAICDSLETHPTIEVLELRTTDTMALAPAVLKSRVQALSAMVKMNMSIHTIQLHSQYSQHELFLDSVIPYLETNRLRPRLLAIQRTRPIPYRAKVLGRALSSVRTDANSFWMLLSGNAEVAFPSSITTIVAAANLPDLSTTAAATSAANVAVIATSGMSASPTTATTSLPAAPAVTTTASSAVPPFIASASDACGPTVAVATAANVATPPAGQKRKSRH
jgi:hypothetical protein